MHNDPFSIANGGISPQMILRAAVRELNDHGIQPSLPFAMALPGNALPIASVEISIERDELPILHSPEGWDGFYLAKIVPAMNDLSKQFTGTVSRTYHLPVGPGSEPTHFEGRVNYSDIAMRARRLGETKLILEVAYS